MNLLNNLTIKNLKLNKKRTLVTIIGIILSVALVTAVATMYSSCIKSLINFQKREKGNFHVAFIDVPAEDVETLKNNQAIDEVFLTKDIGYANLKESKNEYKPYVFVKGFTKEAIKELSVKLVEGRLPENENEILIPTHIKTNGRVILNIGDILTLDVGTRVSEGFELTQFQSFSKEANEEIINTVNKTYKIVGIIERPATNIEEYSAPGYTLITCMDENNMEGKVNVYAKYTKQGSKNYETATGNILDVDERLFKKFINSEEMTKEELKKINNQIGNAKYKIDINQYLILLENNPFDQSVVGNLGVVAGIVCAIIVVTSVFCIKNSFDISITEKIKQYGMLRSVGATKKQIRRNVFFEANILGFIGIPLGIFLGVLASAILILITNFFFNTMLQDNITLEMSFSIIAILVAIVLGFITIYFSALKSAFKAARVSPIESIRNSSNIKIKSKKVRSPKIIKKIFGIGGDLSYRNIKRNKKKYRTTVISIVVSVSIFIALSYFMSVAFGEIDRLIEISDNNISVNYNVSTDKQKENVKNILKLDTIKNYTIENVIHVYLEDPNFNEKYLKEINLTKEDLIHNRENNYEVVSIGEEQYKKYIKELKLDYDKIKDRGILIDQEKIEYLNEKNKKVTKYLRKYDYKENDIIYGKYDNDKETMIDIKIEVGCITDKIPFGLNKNTSYIVVSDEFYNKLNIKLNNTTILIDSSDPDKLQDEIEKVLENEKFNINNMNQNVKTMTNMYILIGIFLYGFIIVISLIGVTNIFNTITTNMNLRRQEFAMLKSIGMTSKEFKRMIRLESIFMGAKALMFGIPIGLILSYLEYKPLCGEMGLPFKIPILAILISIVVVYLLITILMKYSMNKINKQNTIETIRNENI